MKVCDICGSRCELDYDYVFPIWNNVCDSSNKIVVPKFGLGVGTVNL